MSCNDCQRLQMENDILRRQVLKLERIINQVLFYCNNIYNQTNYILSHKSGIPRGQWAYSKGAGKISKKVIEIISW